ncbi:MAG: hypothetical protein QM803_09960 [Rhodocyclaceae bacterium]
MSSGFMYITLSQANAELSLDDHFLLHLAGRGDFPMAVALPKHTRAQKVPVCLSDPAPSVDQHAMEFFELSAEDCRTVENHGSVTRDCFLAAYMKSLHPGYNRHPARDEGGSKSLVWVAVDCDDRATLYPRRVPIRVAREDLYIMGDDYDRLLDAVERLRAESGVPASTAPREAQSEPLLPTSEQPRVETHTGPALVAAPKATVVIDGKVQDENSREARLLALGLIPKSYRDVLDQPIENAVLQVGSVATAPVFNALRDAALESVSPFSGLVNEQGLAYTNDMGATDTLSKKKLADRLYRWRDASQVKASDLEVTADALERTDAR